MSQVQVKKSQTNNILSSFTKQSLVKNSQTFFQPKNYLKPSLNQQQIIDIKATFDVFDSKGQGFINPKDLIQALQSVNYRVKQNTVYQYLLDLASDGAGEITFETFLTMMTTRVTQDDSREDMMQLFSLFDDQKCGYLTIKNLRRMVREFALEVTEQEIQKMIEIADLDQDGRVSEQQFYNFMTAKKSH